MSQLTVAPARSVTGLHRSWDTYTSDERMNILAGTYPNARAIRTQCPGLSSLLSDAPVEATEPQLCLDDDIQRMLNSLEVAALPEDPAAHTQAIDDMFEDNTFVEDEILKTQD